MWNQKPLSSPGGSPKVGGQQQRGNPFAASRPLAGAGAAAPAGAPPVSTAHHTAGYPPAQPRAPTHPPAGPPHQPTYGGIPQPTQQTHPPAPAPSYYPTPPEMHQQGAAPGYPADGYAPGAMGPMAGGGIPQPTQHQPMQQPMTQPMTQQHAPPSMFVPAPVPTPTMGGPSGVNGSASMFVPRMTDGNNGPPPGSTPPVALSSPPPVAFNPGPHTFAPSAGSSGRNSPAGTKPPSVGVGTPLGTPPISLRGREKYCSGGAWVGPAPEWPKPPPDATVANADVSRVRPQHAVVVSALRGKFDALYASSTGSRRKELDGISTKIGGLFVFLNEGEGETHVSVPVADSLASLCTAMNAGDVNTVNAHLLYVSTHHWEEAAYWFPALKRLVKL